VAGLAREPAAPGHRAYRWLNETYLKVDRGVRFYNTHPVPYDGLFWLNRAWLLALGVGGVLLARRSVARSMKGAVASRSATKAGLARREEEPARADAPVGAPPGGFGLAGPRPSFLAGLRSIASMEAREILRQGGLYIFVPMILIQTLGRALTAVGAFDTPILLTPGITAAAAADQLSIFVLLLMIYYTVESLERERVTGLAEILFATPMRTGAYLAGKALANSLVAAAILPAALLACAVALAVEHTVPFSFAPYLLVWGLLLVPTFLFWISFVTAVYAAIGSRWGAMVVSLGALSYSGFRALTGKLSWAGNWALWGVFRWSDLGFYETDRTALVLNRVMVLGAAILFTVVAVRLFARRGPDAVRTIHRLAPSRLAATGAGLLPFAIVPIAAWAALTFQVSQGLEGGAAKKAHKDYWAKNLKTWLDAPLPDIGRVNERLKLDPKRHWLESVGSFTLVNHLDSTLKQVPLTGGYHWKHLAWTMDGRAATPDDRMRLYVFTPPSPLAPGDSVVIGWSFDGRFPWGVTKDGGNTSEFILPSGVVLTGFTPSFMPVLGHMEDVGEEKENHTEPRQYPRDYWKGVTRGGYGATAWFPAHIEITAPAAYTLNSVGVCTRNTVTGGERTQVWDTDHPVKILNVVCGRWKVKRGQGTAIYYSAAHPYNIDEMSSTLDAARHWYSEWFLPYPWRELKLSEFPALAGYAQGFGTNITFSENIGFLTRNTPEVDATFLVTAHESAHQWWGNILTPANGPNADLLSEGMAHFSTMLLMQQVKGPRARMGFAKGIESLYGDRRRVDEERPMYDVDGKRKSDQTVIYDRGGWVFWMIYDFLGHDRALEGYRHFIRTWSQSRDHPALQDFVLAMRPYASDPTAYDAFVKQWCEDRVMPEYRILKARKRRAGTGTDVTVEIRNIGTGTMPVEIAATRGERWAATRGGREDGASKVDPGYRDARGTVTLGAGETKSLVIHCDFDPDRVVVDPDVRVLQLKRKQAVARI
jgi:ABC-2 type transport system permease protein